MENYEWIKDIVLSPSPVILGEVPPRSIVAEENDVGDRKLESSCNYDGVQEHFSLSKDFETDIDIESNCSLDAFQDSTRLSQDIESFSSSFWHNCLPYFKNIVKLAEA
ncbi:MAG: hypothetical protein ACREBR_02515, partial [bacterium]